MYIVLLSYPLALPLASHTHSQTHMHTHTHTHTHNTQHTCTRTLTHMHTHAHTYAQAQGFGFYEHSHEQLQNLTALQDSHTHSNAVVWKGCALIGGILAFFVLEVLLHSCIDGHKHGHSHVSKSTVQNVCLVTSQICNQKEKYLLLHAS